MAIRVILICGPGGDNEGGQSYHGGDEVDDALHGIGADGGGTGDFVGVELEDQYGAADDQGGEPGPDSRRVLYRRVLR